MQGREQRGRPWELRRLQLRRAQATAHVGGTATATAGWTLGTAFTSLSAHLDVPVPADQQGAAAQAAMHHRRPTAVQVQHALRGTKGGCSHRWDVASAWQRSWGDGTAANHNAGQHAASSLQSCTTNGADIKHTPPRYKESQRTLAASSAMARRRGQLSAFASDTSLRACCSSSCKLPRPQCSGGGQGSR